MPRFFFNARRDDGRVLKDEEGLEYGGVAEARAEAERAKHEVHSALLDSGVPPTAIGTGSLEVLDEAGNVLDRIPGPHART